MKKAAKFILLVIAIFLFLLVTSVTIKMGLAIEPANKTLNNSEEVVVESEEVADKGPERLSIVYRQTIYGKLFLVIEDSVTGAQVLYVNHTTLTTLVMGDRPLEENEYPEVFRE